MQVIPLISFRCGFPQNGYLALDGDRAVVIDPDCDAASVLAKLEQAGAQLEYILLTHGHFDHIGGVEALRKATGAHVYIHSLDAHMLRSPADNLSQMDGPVTQCTPADQSVTDGQCLPFGSLQIRVLHTPGHTPGSCCYLLEDVLFAGDTLFQGSVGRWDFPGGELTTLLHSVRGLMQLPDDTRVYAGHGDATTIGREHKYNPFCSEARI